jgi:hypothetical protein
LKILDDPAAQLELPPEMISPVIASIRETLDSQAQTPVTVKSVLDQIDKFLKFMSVDGKQPEVFESLKATAQFLTSTPALEHQWAERFNGAGRLIAIGMSVGAITESNFKQMVEALPPHMADFGMSHCLGLLATPETARRTLSELHETARQKSEAEAWFLVILVQREFGKVALELAKESSRAAELIPRIRRAWLCSFKQPAAAFFSMSEVADDPVDQILMRSPGYERVTFLREVTENGKKLLPSAVWVAEKPPEEEKGFWASLMSSGKPIDEIINEYLKRNPLYSSYRINTPAEEQFAEYLRFSGYGEYGHEFVDRILLGSFIPWADEQKQEVETLLENMWNAIRPDEDILKLDFLRNAIFTRCTTVYASVPDALTAHFLPWLKSTLIDKSLAWRMGNTQFTLHYPETALAKMCVLSAVTVQEVSTDRRDALVKIGLTGYPCEAAIAELAAQLYNSDKEHFELRLPWKPMSDIEEGWQVGIVRNAITPIFKALAQMRGQAENDQASSNS